MNRKTQLCTFISLSFYKDNDQNPADADSFFRHPFDEKKRPPPPHTHIVCMCVVLCVRVWLWQRGMQCGQADKGDEGALIKDGAC